MFQIAVNSGAAGAIVSEKCRNKPFGFGYNAATKIFEDLRYFFTQDTIPDF